MHFVLLFSNWLLNKDIGQRVIGIRGKATHGDAGRMMDVHDTLGVRPGGMDSRMEDEAGHVDAEIRCSRVHHVALFEEQTK